MSTTADYVSAAAEQTENQRTVSRGRQVILSVVRNPSSLLGLAFLLLIVILTVVAPLISRYDPNTMDVSLLNQKPTLAHWFGTDYLGRDMWARVLYGGRTSLPAALGVVAIALGIGVPFGLVSGYMGGIVDDIIMRLVDILLSFPGILLAIGIVAILGPGMPSAVIAIGVASIPYFARMSRGSTLSVKERSYIEAARVAGTRGYRIALRHVLPNIIDPIIILATLNLGYSILATAALSYLGIGAQPPTSDWGSLLSQGYQHMFQAWSEVIFPGLAIVVTVLGINLFGDGLADALNPRQN